VVHEKVNIAYATRRCCHAKSSGTACMVLNCYTWYNSALHCLQSCKGRHSGRHAGSHSWFYDTSKLSVPWAYVSRIPHCIFQLPPLSYVFFSVQAVGALRSNPKSWMIVLAGQPLPVPLSEFDDCKFMIVQTILMIKFIFTCNLFCVFMQVLNTFVGLQCVPSTAAVAT
jgi:hypothetical protein